LADVKKAVDWDVGRPKGLLKKLPAALVKNEAVSTIFGRLPHHRKHVRG
jgi:hypothetical protein